MFRFQVAFLLLAECTAPAYNRRLLLIPFGEAMSDSEHLSGARKWRLALHYSYPIALGYVPAAVAFGVLMSAAGLPAWLSAASSLIVYSGAAQYASRALLCDLTSLKE